MGQAWGESAEYLLTRLNPLAEIICSYKNIEALITSERVKRTKDLITAHFRRILGKDL